MFNFGNEFCTMDPYPGYRKRMDVNITCVKDHSLEHFLLLDGWSQEKVKVRRISVTPNLANFLHNYVMH